MRQEFNSAVTLRLFGSTEDLHWERRAALQEFLMKEQAGVTGVVAFFQGDMGDGIHLSLS